MRNITKYVVLGAGLLIGLPLMTAGKALAHEPRAIAGGGLNVAVGWRTEPAFSRSINAFDFIVSDPVDVDDPQLTINALYLDQDAPDAQVIKSTVLAGALRRDRTNPNRFNIYFMPSRSGAYGFHIEGMVNGMMVDEVFICGGGTQSPDGRFFGCIEDPQRFPAGRASPDSDD